MRMRLFTQIVAILVLIFATTINGLFFNYPKNVLLDFLESFQQKKEMMKPPYNIHHYHLHYYPVPTPMLPKPVKAPIKFDLDKLHSNHLESLGWSDQEYKRVPEPEIYLSAPPRDSWPESSASRPSIWEDENPNNNPQQTLEQPEVSRAGIIVQVPIHQNFLVQPPPEEKEEKVETNPFISFIQGIRRIKNSLFSNGEDNDKTENTTTEPSVTNNINGYVVYLGRDFSRKPK